MADTKTSALSENSVPDTNDFLFWLDDTGPTSYKLSVLRAFGLFNRRVMQGRLTLETGVPVSTTDQAAKTTLYWTPIDDGLISVYDGTRWWGKFQAELSLALSGLTSGKNYDAFISYNAGTPSLVLGPAWTNDTTRATGLTTQDGIRVLSGTPTSRYVGTIRTSGTTTTEDTATKRFVYNAYNREIRSLDSPFVSDSHSYVTNSWREWNAGTNSTRLQFVAGLPLSGFSSYSVNHNGGTSGAVGLDSTTSPGLAVQSQAAGTRHGAVTPFDAAVGYHFLAMLEFGGASGSFADYRHAAQIVA